MDKLWAPWRIRYIQSPRNKGCIFCKAAASKDKNYVFINNEYSFAMLNIFPYNNGHTLIAPKRHMHKTSSLKKEEILDIFKTMNETTRRLNRTLKPHGYNIGVNISEFAGAGIKGHLHFHIVPRWKGDTNFMPVIYNTKVISQSLNGLYRRLKKC